MATTRCEPRHQPRDEVAEAYRLLARRLEQIVRCGVPASEAMVEEACQVAWGRLLDHRDRVGAEFALSWLVKTARREALRLLRLERRQLSLDAAVEQGGECTLGPVIGLEATALDPGPEALVERRERLAAVGALPRRQQRLLWLRALGFSYAEIARYTGDSARTVERQLLRARRALRAVEA